MRAYDVVDLLTKELPRRTNVFTNKLEITSLTFSGSTATAQTSTPHGLSIGSYAVVSGAFEENSLTITFSDGVASAVSSADHGLTLPTQRAIKYDRLYGFNYADVSGSNEIEYNIREILSSVPNRRSFSYAVLGSPSSPATGSPVLRELSRNYNGRFQITSVPDSTTFEYSMTNNPISEGIAVNEPIYADVNPRITAAISAERAKRSYTKQPNKESYWIFVVLGDVLTSKNRRILTDATTENTIQNVFRERLIESFRLLVFVPAKTAYSGREFQDAMENLRGYIYNSLAGYIFPSSLAEEPLSQTSPTGDRYAEEFSDDATYVHEFTFERFVDVTYPDTIGIPDNAPFRDIDGEIGFNTGSEVINLEANLDEQPL